MKLAGVPQTLFEMVGAKPEAGKLSDSTFIIIDAQREYLDCALPAVGMDAAIAETAQLLARARQSGMPVIHVVHRGRGAMFNPASPGFEIVALLRPEIGEPVIEKTLENSFAGSQLAETIQRTGRKSLIFAGFMTHNCLSTTARAARDLGYGITVVARATATRDLPDGKGGVIPAAVVQNINLASLADRTAVVVERGRDIRD
ncbi:MAG TPA: cysteine hydrolase family protein [Gallionella sp.]|nr:cysteine hydrolase family protein [Gallionella sp.]